MIVIRLSGGLGNQMFQYAMGRQLQTSNNDKLFIDLSFLLDRTPREDFVYRDYDLGIFKLQARFTILSKLIALTGYNQKISKIGDALRELKQFPLLGGFKLCQESSLAFDEEKIKMRGNLYIIGAWQSEKYFKAIENTIRNDFSFKSVLSGKTKIISEEISAANSVCVNIRRGDFVNSLGGQKTHGFIGLEYYKNALSLIKRGVPNPVVYIFSDDIEWCEKNISFEIPFKFIGNEYAGYKFSDYLQLMTTCKHFIIPNSSFAWWAAWLNDNPDKIVIAPKQWFADDKLNEQTKDLVPEKWIRL